MIQIAKLANEMSHGDLGDDRLESRAGQLVEMLAVDPAASFPEAARDEAELEAFYRFLRNDSVTFDELLEPHFAATGQRVSRDCQHTVLVAHDETNLELSEECFEGAGPVNGEHGFGFLLHTSVAIRAEGPAVAEGLVGADKWRRQPDDWMADPDSWDDSKDPLEVPDNEHNRWQHNVDQADSHIDETTHAIHLMDRGSDSFRNLAYLAEQADGFILRSNQNRRITDELEGVERPKLEDACAEAPVLTTREVSLSARDNTNRPPSAHQTRQARQATLEIRATTVSIRRPHTRSTELPESVELQVVWAHEIDVPDDCEPVSWRLLTTEPVVTPESALRVIDFYCRRWVIEEFYGALKGTFDLEDRQLRSAQTYLTVLALMMPIAWRLLYIRTLAQTAAELPAEQAVRPSQLGVLAADSSTELESPHGATIHEAMMAIAAMGGHLPRNGPPGWETLQRGYQKLLIGELNWIKGRQSLKDRIQQKWQSADDPDEFGHWLEDLELEDHPLTYDQS